MFRFLFVAFTILCFTKVASAVILVVPDENDWGESSRHCLFRAIEKYSIVPCGLNSETAQSYLKSNLTEKEFVQKNISRLFPKKSFRIEDVPATLVDIAALHESFFKLYERREDDNLYNWLPTDKWSENTRKNIYFAVSKMVLSAVDQEKSYEEALRVLFQGIPKNFQEAMFGRIQKDLNSPISILKEGLRQEENALKNDSFVWFRGTKGVKINTIGEVLDFPIDLSSPSANSNLKDFHTLSPEEQFKSMQSFSFGVSLLAGVTADGGACAYSYAINGGNCYALQIPKKYFFSETGNQLWRMPNVNSTLQVLSSGESFHPRSNGRKVDGYSLFSFRAELDYTKLALAMSDLLLNNTTLIQYNRQVVTENSHRDIKKDLHEVYQKLHDILNSEKR